MQAYRITQWNELYERSETRKVDFMPWYPKQAKLMGLGIGFTLSQRDNLELLGLWNLLEVIACQSKKNHRGWLVRNGVPLTAAMMSSLIPTVPADKWERALAHFSSAEVNWLELVPIEQCGNSPGNSPSVLPPPGNSPGNSPGSLPAPDDKAAPDGSAVGNAPGNIPTPGKNSATDRQTDRQIRDRQTDSTNKKASLREGGQGTVPPAVAVQAFAATRIQFAALSARKKELEQTERAKWSEEQRTEWKEIRASLDKLGKHQRRGL